MRVQQSKWIMLLVTERTSKNDILPVKQKGCKKKSRGTKDQFLIDKKILRDCR